MFTQQPPLPLFHFTFSSIFNAASSSFAEPPAHDKRGDPAQLSPPARSRPQLLGAPSLTAPSHAGSGCCFHS